MYGQPTYDDGFVTVISNCRATGDEEDEGGGGILVSEAAPSSMAAARSATVRLNHMAAGSVSWTAQVPAERMACKAARPDPAGACARREDVSLVDVSLEECGSNMCASARAVQQRGRFARSACALATPRQAPEGCTLTPCFSPQQVDRQHLLDCDGTCLDTLNAWARSCAPSVMRAISRFAVLAVPPSILTMTDSYIADCEDGCLKEQRHAGPAQHDTQELHCSTDPGQTVHFTLRQGRRSSRRSC